MTAPTPRMLEIAARVGRAWTGAAENQDDRRATQEEFFSHAMEDIVYLLGKFGVEMPTLGGGQ